MPSCRAADLRDTRAKASMASSKAAAGKTRVLGLPDPNTALTAPQLCADAIRAEMRSAPFEPGPPARVRTLQPAVDWPFELDGQGLLSPDAQFGSYSVDVDGLGGHHMARLTGARAQMLDQKPSLPGTEAWTSDSRYHVHLFRHDGEARPG